jgi:hypothetical protein
MLFFWFVLRCVAGQPGSPPVPATPLNRPVPLTQQKRTLDAYVQAHPSSFVTYARLGNGQVVPVKNAALPDATQTVYRVLRNRHRGIVLIQEAPVSESGDWSLTYTHYFTPQGRTFAYERRTAFFNSQCTESAAHETKVQYYDAAFRPRQREYRLTDSDGTPLPQQRCSFPYQWAYQPSKTVSEFAKKNKLLIR